VVFSKKPTPREEPTVQSVPLSGLPRTRRGKHFALMQHVLQGLAALPKQSALKVHLGENSAKDIRSAVVRAARARNIEITTRSDENHLYVWKKPAVG
jgi:hypothetical protein